jgi:DNA-binding response OmpR family regulator
LIKVGLAMNDITILVVEDDPAIRVGVVDTLKSEGYRVIVAEDGFVGQRLALEETYDLILLDLMLPGVDGLQILEAVRGVKPEVPVILATARGDESERIRGLQAGADDYVVKPYSVRELLARIQAVLRRYVGSPENELLTINGGVIDFSRREITYPDGTTASLSERESQPLYYLNRHRDRAVARGELLAKVWGIDPTGVNTRAIDMLVARLREKLGDNCEMPQFLLTVRGKGYMLSRSVPLPKATDH